MRKMAQNGHNGISKTEEFISVAGTRTKRSRGEGGGRAPRESLTFTLSSRRAGSRYFY